MVSHLLTDLLQDPSLHLNMAHPNESHGAGAAAGEAATAGAALTEGSSPNSAGLTTATTPAASMTPLASPPVSGSATQAAEADVFTWEDVLDPLTFPTYFPPAWESINDLAEELAIRDGLLRIQADVFRDLQASQKRVQDYPAQQNNS